MEHKPVTSSNIASVAYNEATKTLEVRFKGNSGTYSYEGVPKETYDRLLEPNQSVGKFFHESVKGKYQHKKV